jgi:dTDP-4-amino-4,6-dideoxygalactose transaminase
VITPVEKEFAKHVFHLYIITSTRRNALAEHLRSCGVAVGLHYPIALHLQQAHAHLGYGQGSFPVAERCAEQVLSLPMFAELTEEQIQHVVNGIKKFV